MATLFDEWAVRLGFEVDEQSAAKVDDASRGLGARAVAVGNLISGAITKGVELAIGAVQRLVGGAVQLVEHFAEVGGEIADTSAKVGTSTDTLQRLRFAFQLQGVDAGKATDAIRELSKGYEEAKDKGTGPFAEGLAAVGVKLSELRDLDADERIGLLADALNELPSESAKTAAALKLFGGAGADLLPVLRGGSEGLEQWGRKAEELGLILDKDAIAKSERLGDALDVVRAQLGAAAAKTAEALAPAAASMAERVGDWIAENEQFIAQDLPAVITSIVEAMGDLVAWTADVVSEFRQLGREVSAFVDDVEALATEVRDDLQPAIDAVTTVASAWADAFTSVNTAIGDGIAAVLEYLGVLDTLKAAWEALPFTGESVDELTARLHGGTRSERAAPEFLSPEARGRASERDLDALARAATALVQADRTAAAAERYAAKHTPPRKGRRAYKLPSGGGGGGKGKDFMDSIAPDTVALADRSAPNPAGGGAGPLAGATFNTVQIAYNTGDVIVKLPPGAARSASPDMLARVIADAVGAEVERANRAAAAQLQTSIRGV